MYFNCNNCKSEYTEEVYNSQKGLHSMKCNSCNLVKVYTTEEFNKLFEKWLYQKIQRINLYVSLLNNQN